MGNGSDFVRLMDYKSKEPGQNRICVVVGEVADRLGPEIRSGPGERKSKERSVLTADVPIEKRALRTERQQRKERPLCVWEKVTAAVVATATVHCRHCRLYSSVAMYALMCM